MSKADTYVVTQRWLMLQTSGGATACVGGGAGAAPTTNLLGFASRLDYNDKLQNNQRPVAEIGMTILPYQMSVYYIDRLYTREAEERAGGSFRIGSSGLCLW